MTNSNFRPFLICFIIIFMSCKNHDVEQNISEEKKKEILNEINKSLAIGIEATINKDIEAYMSLMPKDLVIYDESGEIISREKQREYALRDWAIIDTTLFIENKVDSINYLKPDSIIVYTSQKWERMMFRRDHITTDTILTTQKHKEIWKHTAEGWFGYDIIELGGEVFINGEKYEPN